MLSATFHQPVFFPYLGVFDKIKDTDIFVLMDDDQYVKNSWFNRNRVKVCMNSKIKWLTIPVPKGQSFFKIDKIKIEADGEWKKSHLNFLKENYSKSSKNASLLGWTTNRARLISLSSLSRA